MEKSLHELRERLLRSGVAPRHVRRYVAELDDHLADLRAEGEGAGLSRAEADSAALVRLGGIDELSAAMAERTRFRSWCSKAPWAAFGLAPVILLSGNYLVACLILWTGWNIFLPGVRSPFIPVSGLAMPYFAVGKTIFFCAPVVIGWGIGFIAARQRLRAFWPLIGLLLVSLVGGMARVHAVPPSHAAAAGHVSMSLALGDFVLGITNGLLHAFVILLFTAVPYLLWQGTRLRWTHQGANSLR